MATATPTINRPDSPGSDTDSVVSSVIHQGPSRPRFGSLASANYSSLNLSSLGLGTSATTSTTSAKSSSLLNGFNGISTVLNNPRKKQHAIDPNSSRWPPLPAHKEAEIIRPSKQTVQSYIDEASSEWQRYVRNRNLGSRGKAKTSEEAPREQPSEGDARQSSSINQAAKGKLPAISSVPQVFFDEDFNLGNPYTFDIVTEKYGSASAIAGPSSSSREQSGPSIQGDHVEKLSHYSDLVEQHLLHEIATRSGSFFSALGALQDLAHSSTSCLSLTRSLRADLNSIIDNQVKTGLRIVRKQDERRTTVKQMQAVERIQRWCEGKRMAELMVAQGEYDEGLLVIESLQKEAAPPRNRETELSSYATGSVDEDGQSAMNPPFASLDGLDALEDDLDFSQIPAIVDLLPELENLKSSITISLEAELTSVLQAGLDPHSPSASDEASWLLQSRVRPLIESLTRTQGLEKALIASYRPLALASVRQALQASLPSAAEEPVLASLFDLLDDDVAATGRGESRSGEAGATAARRLREMNAADFALLIKRVCSGLEAGVGRVERQKTGILQILDTLARSRWPSIAAQVTEAEEVVMDQMMPQGVPLALPALFNSQLQACVEVAHILVARLISLRASTHAQLALPEFLGVYTLLMEFVERTEKISLDKGREPSSTVSRKLVPLRSTLLNQAKEWLRYFHRLRLEQAARWVEEETWAQADVPPESIQILRTLVAAATGDPVEWVSGDSSMSGDVKVDEQTDPVPLAKTLVFPTEVSNGALGGDEKSYYMVPATLRVLALTQEYMQTVVNFEKVGTTEIMSRVVEFLKQFNSRTCQVVLGAGAMRSAGLKNITAKHLALASQSLSLFIHLIPYLRECVRRHLPDERQSIMLVEFDKLKRDFQEHQFEIHAKLVAIMGDRLNVHCRGLAATKWNSPLASTAQDEETARSVAASKPITDLIKETTTLHKVLSKYLQASIVENVFTQVLEAIVTRVGVEYARVEVTREGGDACQMRMKEDLNQLDQKLGSLRGVNWDSTSLRAVVGTKVPPPSAPVAVAAPSMPSGLPSTPSKSGTTSAAQTPTSGGDAEHPPRAGPAPYRSKFPFARRGGTPQHSGPLHTGSPNQTPVMGTASPIGTPRSSFQQLSSREAEVNGSQRRSIDVASPRPAEQSAVTLGRSQEPAKAPAASIDLPASNTVESEKQFAETLEPAHMGQASAERQTEMTSDGPAIGMKTDKITQEDVERSTNQVDEPAASSEAHEQPSSISEAHKEDINVERASVEPLVPPVVSDQSVQSGTFGSPALAGSDTSVAPAAAALYTSSSASDESSRSSLPAPPASPSLSAPVSTTTSGVSTPTRGARMTLQQRLAEAARKRASAAGAPSNLPPVPPTRQAESNSGLKTDATESPSAVDEPMKSEPVEPAIGPTVHGFEKQGKENDVPPPPISKDDHIIIEKERHSPTQNAAEASASASTPSTSASASIPPLSDMESSNNRLIPLDPGAPEEPSMASMPTSGAAVVPSLAKEDVSTTASADQPTAHRNEPNATTSVAGLPKEEGERSEQREQTTGGLGLGFGLGLGLGLDVVDPHSSHTSGSDPAAGEEEQQAAASEGANGEEGQEVDEPLGAVGGTESGDAASTGARGVAGGGDGGGRGGGKKKKNKKRGGKKGGAGGGVSGK